MARRRQTGGRRRHVRRLRRPGLRSRQPCQGRLRLCRPPHHRSPPRPHRPPLKLTDGRAACRHRQPPPRLPHRQRAPAPLPPAHPFRRMRQLRPVRQPAPSYRWQVLACRHRRPLLCRRQAWLSLRYRYRRLERRYRQSPRQRLSPSSRCRPPLEACTRLRQRRLLRRSLGRSKPSRVRRPITEPIRPLCRLLSLPGPQRRRWPLASLQIRPRRFPAIWPNHQRHPRCRRPIRRKLEDRLIRRRRSRRPRPPTHLPLLVRLRHGRRGGHSHPPRRLLLPRHPPDYPLMPLIPRPLPWPLPSVAKSLVLVPPVIALLLCHPLLRTCRMSRRNRPCSERRLVRRRSLMQVTRQHNQAPHSLRSRRLFRPRPRRYLR